MVLYRRLVTFYLSNSLIWLVMLCAQYFAPFCCALVNRVSVSENSTKQSWKDYTFLLEAKSESSVFSLSFPFKSLDHLCDRSGVLITLVLEKWSLYEDKLHSFEYRNCWHNQVFIKGSSAELGLGADPLAVRTWNGCSKSSRVRAWTNTALMIPHGVWWLSDRKTSYLYGLQSYDQQD